MESAQACVSAHEQASQELAAGIDALEQMLVDKVGAHRFILLTTSTI